MHPCSGFPRGDTGIAVSNLVNRGCHAPPRSGGGDKVKTAVSAPSGLKAFRFSLQIRKCFQGIFFLAGNGGRGGDSCGAVPGF